MGMFEFAHNSCYCKDGVARYRDFENDIDVRDLARELAWSLADIELSNDNECFDEEMIENLQYDITQEPIGLIALFYRNLWAMADLREKLKEYEDLEEQGLLLQLPLRIGTDIYFIPSELNFKLNIINNHKEDNCVYHQKVKRIIFNEFGWSFECDKDIEYELDRIFIDKTYQKTWFLTYKEAYQKLKEM